MGFAPQFFGCDGMDGILTVENFDTSLAEGLMLLTPFSADEEGSQDFVAAYEEAYGMEPIQFAADAYDAVYAIKAAAEQGGCNPGHGSFRYLRGNEGCYDRDHHRWSDRRGHDLD